MSETTTATETAVTVEGAMTLPAHAPLCVTLPRDGFPNSTSKGNLLNTIENLQYLCAQYGVLIRYNEMSHKDEITIPGREYTRDNRDNCSIAELLSLCALNGMPRSNVMDYVQVIASDNAYSPVREWIHSKPWDGESRLQSFFDTVKVVADYPVDFKETLMRRWLLNAVACVYEDTHETHGVLVMTGPQGVGKTRWFSSLVPRNRGFLYNGALLDPADKDSVLTATSHWLVELGELDGNFRKADIARLKSFVSKDTDKVRRPYARTESEMPRRTVFGGSVNDTRYLVDDSGNRRWWTLHVESIDHGHSIDMQQLWAEVLALYRAGEQTWLTPDENRKLGELNGERFQSIDPLEELVLEAFDFESVQHDLPGFQSRPTQWLSATSVLKALGINEPKKLQSNSMSALLKKLTGVESSKRSGQRVFPMPAKRLFAGADK
jgi:predicted P-loop ATPase